MRAGDSVTLQQHLRVADPAAGEAASEAGAPSGHKEARGSFTRFRLNLAMQELTGPLLRSRGLRYKKKMWSFRTASEPVPAALAAPGGRGSGGQGHVAYCMMTFIIRNGIKQLKESEAVYEGYVDALVRRWGLPAEQCRRVKVRSTQHMTHCARLAPAWQAGEQAWLRLLPCIALITRALWCLVRHCGAGVLNMMHVFRSLGGAGRAGRA